MKKNNKIDNKNKKVHMANVKDNEPCDNTVEPVTKRIVYEPLDINTLNQESFALDKTIKYPK